jgi:thymidylate kinase
MQISEKASLPKLIFIVGVDGVGKTHFTERLLATLETKGINARRLWVRFMNITTKPLLGFCRLIGLSYYEKKDSVVVGYHDFERSKVVSQLFILFQLLDVWIVTIFRIWPRIIKGQTLICDRGAYDTLIDVMVDTKNTSLYNSRLGKAFIWLLPSAHKVIFILREPDQIFLQRPDVKFDRNFELRCQLYNACSDRFKWSSISNNGTSDETFRKIKTELTLS